MADTEDSRDQSGGDEVDRRPPNAGVVDLAANLARLHRPDDISGYNFAARTDTQRAENRTRFGDRLADELANNPNVPELYTFAGYLGGLVDQVDPTGARWQLLYLDAKLFTWLLLNVQTIVLTTNDADDTSPFGTRDYVWMESDASVSRGEGPIQRNEIQARFLRGAFVSAADFAASVTGGTYAPGGGPAFALTPGCCGIRTR